MPQDTQPATLRALLRQLDEQGITDHRRYHAVRKFLNFKAREKNLPISGSFELTPLCNLDCKMCYVHLNKAQMQGASLLTVDQWRSIMQQAIDSGMMYARLTGGECLTYPGFWELYSFLHSKGIETAILTNGLLMDSDMVQFLTEHPPSAVQLTLCGASDDAYVDLLKLQQALKGQSIEAECDPESLTDPGGAQPGTARGVRCGAGRSNFAVDWQGQMRPCNTFPAEPADVLTLGFTEAWARTNHAALNYPLPTECEGLRLPGHVQALRRRARCPGPCRARQPRHLRLGPPNGFRRPAETPAA